ncbi:MAG: hypothetical protein U1E77_21855 [Inhella sp.]
MLAKFLPGLSILAALAGAMGMPAATFKGSNGAKKVPPVWAWARCSTVRLSSCWPPAAGQQALLMLAGLVAAYLLWRSLRRLHEQFALRGSIGPTELLEAPTAVPGRAGAAGRARTPARSGAQAHRAWTWARRTPRCCCAGPVQ